MTIDKIQFNSNRSVATILKDGVALHIENFASGEFGGFDKLSLHNAKTLREKYFPPSGSRFVDFVCRGDHSVFLNDEGELFCLGLKYLTMKNKACKEPRKVHVPDNEKVKQFHTTVHNTFILTESGMFYAVGRNDDLQLGIEGRTKRSTKWIMLNPNFNVTFDDITFSHYEHVVRMCARTTRGTFYVFGDCKLPYEVDISSYGIIEPINKLIPEIIDYSTIPASKYVGYALTDKHVYPIVREEEGTPQIYSCSPFVVANATAVFDYRKYGFGIIFTTKEKVKIWNGYPPGKGMRNGRPTDFSLTSYLKTSATFEEQSVELVGIHVEVPVGTGSVCLYTKHNGCVYSFVKRITADDDAGWVFNSHDTVKLINASESSILEYPEEYIETFM